MIAVDTGILALALNRWAPEHARAAQRLEDLANDDAPWAVTWSALHELVEHVTHRHAVARPLAPADAVSFVEQLRASPSLRTLGPTSRHGAVLREVIDGLGATGVPWRLDTAVTLREHGVRELLSTDPGMRRYGFLTVIDPLHGEGWRTGEPPRRRYRQLRPRPGR